MKFLRIFFSILALFLVVCVLAVVSLLLFIDPNKLKPVITDQVMAKTGYQLAIDGNLTWSFYPRLGVKTEHIALTAPNEKSAFADLQGVTMATELLQLLRGREKMTGEVHIDALTLINAKLQNVNLGLHWQDNVLTLDPVTASLYDGNLQAVIHVRDITSMPSLDWDAQFNQIQVKPFLEDLNGADSKIKIAGIGLLKMRLSTKGLTQQQLLSNLNGKTGFVLTNGAIEGIDLNYYVQAADALINRTPNPATMSEQTAFDSFIGVALMTNGVAKSDNLTLNSPAFVAKAQGSYDLSQQTLDYQLQITPLHVAGLQWAIPVILSGDVSHPDIRLDMLKLQTMVAKEELEKAGKKIEKELKKLPAKADKFFKKLLGE